MSAERSMPVRMEFIGPETSRSGYRALTAVDREHRDGASWPYVCVAVVAPGGERVYRSPRYAAWLSLRLCWDDADRLWIASSDSGTDVVAAREGAWRRYRWMAEPAVSSLLDASSGERIDVVDWTPPVPIRRRKKP